MKRNGVYIYLLCLIVMAGCAKKNNSGEEARARFEASLSDSIQAVTAEIDSCNGLIAELETRVSEELGSFTVVNNSREVEGYMIYTGWQDRYPLQATGLIARISSGEQLELIAALKGGVFDQIRVSSAEGSAESSVVPHDQALNYRREGLTTVLFSGAAADSVAQMITSGATVTYLQGGRKTGSWSIPSETAGMIGASRTLYSDRKEQTRKERRVVMLNEKKKLYREAQEK